MQINRIYQSQQHRASANDATDLQSFINKYSRFAAATGERPTES